MSRQSPSAPTASAIGPCPTIIQIVGRSGTGSLPRTIAPPDHPRPKWPIPVGRWSWIGNIEKHRKIFCNLFSQNHQAEMLEIWYAALPSGPLPSLFKCGPGVKKRFCGRAGGLRFKNRIYFINLLQNHSAQSVEIVCSII